MNSVGTVVVYSLHRGLGPGGAEKDAVCMDGKIHRWHEGGERLCPASPEKEDQRAAGSPAALTQLALCLRLAPDLKGRKLATRRNPQWLVNPK